MSRLYIIGAGGMARECKDLLEALGRADELEAFVEEPAERSAETTSDGLHVVDVRDLPKPAPDVRLTCAIGSLRRKRLLDRLEQAGYQFETLVDPRAIVRSTAIIGAGSIVMAGAIVSDRVAVGRHSIVNFQCSVSHDVTIGDCCTLCPGVHVGGWAKVGAQTWLGIGAVLRDRVSVGARSYVGAGACVVDDIGDGVLAYGVPARPAGPFDPSEDR